MAFDIRCPECKARLRLDEAPDPDTPIECPRCGSQFAAPAPERPAAKPARSDKIDPMTGERKKRGKMPKKRKVKKQKTNPIVLLIAIGFGFAALIAVGILMVWFLNRAGKVEEMLTYVPDSCNWARGVNVSQLSRYPGYKPEVEKYMTGPVAAAANELAQAAGHDPGTFVDYLVVAKNKSDRGASTMYVFRTQRSFKPDVLGANLLGATAQGDGTYRLAGSAPGVLSGATVHMPTRRLVVVIPPDAQSMVSGSLAGKNGRDGTFAGQLDATARVVIRGSIWLVVHAAGGEKAYIANLTGLVDQDFKAVTDQGKNSTTFGMWTTPGGNGVRVGAAMQCASSKDADSLVRTIREGPLGKADESEPTNQLRKSWSVSTDKKAWGEFMQYVDFRSKRDCAYLVSTVSGDNAKRFMDMFNNPGVAAGESSFGGFGGDPRGGFGPPGGPPQPGLPGGVAPPGMAGPNGPGR
jgi:hypothetical protein